MNPHYDLVALRAGHRCEYCHAPEAVFNFPFEVEHIIPLVRDGADARAQLGACLPCLQCPQGVHIGRVDPVTHVVVRLYHPRQESWHDHFRVDTDTGVIEGSDCYRESNRSTAGNEQSGPMCCPPTLDSSGSIPLSSRSTTGMLQTGGILLCGLRSPANLHRGQGSCKTNHGRSLHRAMHSGTGG